MNYTEKKRPGIAGSRMTALAETEETHCHEYCPRLTGISSRHGNPAIDKPRRWGLTLLWIE